MNHSINNTDDKNNISNPKIGILGGTFDPIHNGHLMIAEAALKEYALSKIIFIPTGISYMKSDVTDSFFRYEMVKLAIRDNERFEISDVEIQREGNTYTCDTIAYFRDKQPSTAIYFIIGTDSLFSLEKWRNSAYILQNCTILCATRNGDYNEDAVERAEIAKAEELNRHYNADIRFIHCKPMDISSTDIRNYRKEHPDGGTLEHLELPQTVADYILHQDLYDDQTEEIHRLLKEDLKPKRFRHTIGVVETAVCLAQKWGCDPVKARIAALLHDCAKYTDTESKRAICAKYGVQITTTESANPELLHAKAGALVAHERYGIDDKEILSAIYYHTTGKPDMTLLEQIIFVADYIEPGRNHSEKLPEYRQLAMNDLNLVTAKILKDTVKYLKKQQEKDVIIDPQTNEAYEFYKKYMNS